jgi:thiol-disulfide isomerase/thioredoxin
MTNENRLRLPALKLAIAAIVLGGIAGAGAVYMKAQGSGNASAQATGDCAGAIEHAAALKPFIKGQVAALVPANPPRKIEGFAFKGPDGQDMTLASFKGKTVLLNLWATWCIPCRVEMPALNALQKDEGADGKFEVAAVNIDTGDDEKPMSFRKENGIDALAFYRDNTLGTFNKMKKEGLAIGLPATMVINPEGCLVASMNGPAAWDSADAKALLKAVAQ